MSRLPVLVPSRHASAGGFALILVLACLVFITVLVIAFTMSMRTERVSSQASLEVTRSRSLADTAVNLAMSQVQDAATLSGESNLTWASQPGMIRLYDAAGNAAGYRKLFSWDTMVGSGAFNPFSAAEQPPANWQASPSVYVDLNAPVTSSGVPVYPIVDPIALDPNPAVDGPTGSAAVNQFTIDASAPVSGTNPIPMPVKWLYVLQDGSVHPPGSGSSGNRAVIPAADDDNRIVGRIAFWADDESTKININTASATSENTFWDVPRFSRQGDVAMARNQPARLEFQRYPGHPATVSLNKDVFSDFTSPTQMQQLFALTPRVDWGGSMDGSRPFTLANSVTIQPDRLYTSVDELIFDPARNAQGLTKDRVRAAQFFLTANSRSPELNVFGLPRVAAWPLSENNDNLFRTPADRLIAFASTVGGRPFYFTRLNRWSSTDDIERPRNRQLLDYLDNLTQRSIPGFGGSFQQKYSADRRQILTQIYDYIRLTNAVDSTQPRTPSLSPTTAPQRRFADLLRQNANGTLERWWAGQIMPSVRTDWGTAGFGNHPRISAAALHFVGLGRGESPQGVSQVLPQQPGVRSPEMLPSGDAPEPRNLPPPNTVATQAYLLFQFLNVTHSWQIYEPQLWIQVNGLDAFEINGQSMGFPASATMRASRNASSSNTVASGASGLEDFRRLTHTTTLDAATGGTHQSYRFFSHIFPVPIDMPMDFTGGTLTVRVYAALPPMSAPFSDTTLIQTLEIEFPDEEFPAPRLGNVRLVGHKMSGAEPEDRWNSFGGGSTNPYTSVIEADNDVVQSVEWVGEGAVHGDYRLAAGRRPDELVGGFQPNPGYGSQRMAHSLSQTFGQQFAGSGALERGVFVSGAPHRIKQGNNFESNSPAMPSGVPAVGIGGDWDNGVGRTIDGPFINKADEGDARPDNAYYGGLGAGTLESEEPGESHFSPNRQIPSPAMFGSLPTGVKAGVPWRTLHFRPANPNNPLPAGPPDHTLLDLFWMPVAEPYAISEPFSTAGKINLNQQIVPFTYINRWTGLRALLASEKITRVALNQAGEYKRLLSPVNTPQGTYRFGLNLSATDGTLRQFRERFNAGEIFRSGTEICDIFLVPEDRTWTTDTQARSQWYGNDFAMVGDNVRERPYANLYGRVTTKSNVFNVHYRAQVLTTPATPGADPTVFDTTAGGRVVAERRGNTIFERFIDPNDPWLIANDPATPGTPSLESLYRVRIISANEFNP